MSLQNGPVAETRPAFDATFTQINMNHSEPGKRRPRRGGAVQWRCGPPIIVRSSGGGGFHTGTLRGHAPAAVTQESRLSLLSEHTRAFVPAKMQAVPTRFVGWISHLLYCFCLCLRNLIWSVATVHPINLSFRLGKRAGRAVVSFSRVTVPILPPSFSPSTRTDIKMTPLRDPRGDAAWKPQPFNMIDRHIKSVCPAMMRSKHNDPISPQN